MAYYIDTNNNLHYVDSSAYEYLLPKNSSAIDDKEAISIQKSKEAVEKAKLDALPKADNFVEAIKSSLGGIVGLNALTSSYPLLLTSIQLAKWQDAQELIIDAKAKSVITSAQYDSIKSAAVQFNIPISL